MEKLIEIGGCIEVPEELTEDEFYDKFIGFIEANGWYFGGSMRVLEEEDV